MSCGCKEYRGLGVLCADGSTWTPRPHEASRLGYRQHADVLPCIGRGGVAQASTTAQQTTSPGVLLAGLFVTGFLLWIWLPPKR